jgi:hypothetical protein
MRDDAKKKDESRPHPGPPPGEGEPSAAFEIIGVSLQSSAGGAGWLLTNKHCFLFLLLEAFGILLSGGEF